MTLGSYTELEQQPENSSIDFAITNTCRDFSIFLQRTVHLCAKTRKYFRPIDILSQTISYTPNIVFESASGLNTQVLEQNSGKESPRQDVREISLKKHKRDHPLLVGLFLHRLSIDDVLCFRWRNNERRRIKRRFLYESLSVIDNFTTFDRLQHFNVFDRFFWNVQWILI